ncbi:MAG: histidine--tRNA ligase [Clostridiales bacterium]|nr:histidine--tRNA ligase [Clostridiales bacterium]
MNLITKRVKGTQDVLPSQSYKWQFVEKLLSDEAKLCGYKEIRTPVFEHTELFNRSVGETTDVVQKEMYTFNTKGGTSITLRPEGTAGAARAMLENAVYNDGLPIKVYYNTSCYRYEKPQAGRYREFHQFGMELYGTQSPSADADLICTVDSMFKRMRITDLRLEINSIGCPTCRAKFQQALKDYFSQYKDKLCETCLSRLDRNPMRILDCKSPVCKQIAEDAPTVLDYLCDECSLHFNKVRELLDCMGVKYTVNPKIVRGLDYYTKTVFEFVSDSIGAQGTVCGGGRYDGLVEELGGQAMPALGFALGMERLLSLMEALNIELPEPENCGVYFIGLGEPGQKEAFRLTREVRNSGIYADCDICSRSLKAQMKYADKIGARFTVVIGDDEVNTKKAVMKNMQTGEKFDICLDERFFETFTVGFLK